MKSKVFLTEIKAGDPVEVWDEQLCRLFKAANLEKAFKPGDFTAVKLHFGEDGANTHMQPHMVKPLVESLKAAGTQPFLTDTATLYAGSRSNAVNHGITAAKHGFCLETTGAPVIFSDGLFGNSEIEVETSGKHYRTVRLAADLVRASSMLVVSHVTGHCACSFGAALKNVGMGCASRKGKLSQHSSLKPTVNRENCIGCGICTQWCPVAAIKLLPAENVAVINGEICIGCGECLSMCPHDAVCFDWEFAGTELQERMAEYAVAMHKQKAPAIAYVNIAVNITKECDCFGIMQEPVTPDIGVLASFDPVALDMASLELTKDSQGRTFAENLRPEFDAGLAMRHAAALGAGSLDFELITVP